MCAILALLLIVLPVYGWAQSPPAGIPIDSRGNQTVDPTKNVLDLVLAAVKRIDDLTAAHNKRQDDLRDMEARIQAMMRDADTRRANDLREADNRRSIDLREAETRRIDQLASQKQAFDLELARINKSNVDASALLLATAVKELKTDSSDRTAKLEQFANEQRGRTSGGNEAWALVAGLIMMLLVAVGIIVNMMRTRRETT